MSGPTKFKDTQKNLESPRPSYNHPADEPGPQGPAGPAGPPGPVAPGPSWYLKALVSFALLTVAIIIGVVVWHDLSPDPLLVPTPTPARPPVEDQPGIITADELPTLRRSMTQCEFESQFSNSTSPFWTDPSGELWTLDANYDGTNDVSDEGAWQHFRKTYRSMLYPDIHDEYYESAVKEFNPTWKPDLRFEPPFIRDEVISKQNFLASLRRLEAANKADSSQFAKYDTTAFSDYSASEMKSLTGVIGSFQNETEAPRRTLLEHLIEYLKKPYRRLTSMKNLDWSTEENPKRMSAFRRKIYTQSGSKIYTKRSVYKQSGSSCWANAAALQMSMQYAVEHKDEFFPTLSADAYTQCERNHFINTPRYPLKSTPLEMQVKQGKRYKAIDHFYNDYEKCKTCDHENENDDCLDMDNKEEVCPGCDSGIPQETLIWARAAGSVWRTKEDYAKVSSRRRRPSQSCAKLCKSPAKENDYGYTLTKDFIDERYPTVDRMIELLQEGALMITIDSSEISDLTAPNTLNPKHREAHAPGPDACAGGPTVNRKNPNNRNPKGFCKRERKFDHAVVITGYEEGDRSFCAKAGIEHVTPGYTGGAPCVIWHIQNSHGTQVHTQGWFKLLAGRNYYGVEDRAIQARGVELTSRIESSTGDDEVMDWNGIDWGVDGGR